MHKRVSLNHKLIESSAASISALSNAGLYGKGVFSTMAIHDGLPFLFDKHWSRLEANARQLNIHLNGLRKELLFSSVMTLLDHNAVSEGKCRVTLFDGESSRLWNTSGGFGTSVLIQTGHLRTQDFALSLCVSPFPVTMSSPLNNIKSCNYLERILAFEHAADSGFSEAVRLNELGEIVSACMANLFWVKEGRVYTPSLDSGGLAGTTREYVIEKCKTREVRTGVETLLEADNVFLTSAGFGIATVGELSLGVERREYRTLDEDLVREHNLTQLMRF
jgi:branched-subunit amino acid aminotransferase/4-amino-4-deoxychorismate lyase